MARVVCWALLSASLASCASMSDWFAGDFDVIVQPNEVSTAYYYIVVLPDGPQHRKDDKALIKTDGSVDFKKLANETYDHWFKVKVHNPTTGSVAEDSVCDDDDPSDDWRIERSWGEMAGADVRAGGFPVTWHCIPNGVSFGFARSFFRAHDPVSIGVIAVTTDGEHHANLVRYVDEGLERSLADADYLRVVIRQGENVRPQLVP